MKYFICLCLFIVGSSPISLSQTTSSGSVTGSISGRVLDSEGDVIPDADILVVGSSSSSTNKARGAANHTGSYKIEGLKMGDYVIYPYKISAGYQLGSNTFFADDPARFRLGDSQPDQTLDIRTPPRAAEVKCLIRNSSTMTALANINVWLCRTDDPTRAGQITTEQDGHFEHAVPASVPISIFVDAQGFQPQLIKNLVFLPLEAKEITVDLVPRLNTTKPDIKGYCHFPWQQ
jgi:hypothetical protein